MLYKLYLHQSRGVNLTGRKKKKKLIDERVTIKIDKSLWRLLSDKISKHPEWGIKSVSDFIRRAIDNELNVRLESPDRKVLEVRLRNFKDSPKDSRDKDP